MKKKLSVILNEILKDPDFDAEEKKARFDQALEDADNGHPNIEDDRPSKIGMGVGGEAATVREPGLAESGIKGVAGVLGDLGIGAGKNLGRIANKLFPNRESISKENAPASSLRFGKFDAKSSVGRSNTPEEEAALQPEGIAENLGSMASDMALLQGSPIGAGVKAAVKGEGLLASAIRAALTGAGETAGLNAVKGQDTTERELLTSGAASGALGLAAKGGQQLTKGYLAGKLNDINERAVPTNIEQVLRDVLDYTPGKAGSFSLNPITKSLEKDALKLSSVERRAIDQALPGRTSKDAVESIVNKAAKEGYFPSVRNGLPGNLDVQKLNPQAATTEYATTLEQIKAAIDKMASVSNPRKDIVPITKTSKVTVPSLIEDLSGNKFPIEKTVKTAGTRTKNSFINPDSGAFVKGIPGQEEHINNADLLDFASYMENLPNQFKARTQDPKDMISNRLFSLLRDSDPDLKRLLERRANRVEQIRLKEGLFDKSKQTGNDLIGVSKTISGLKAGNLPYALSSLGSTAGGVSAARRGYAGSKQFEEVVLPQILKAIAATTAAKPLQGRQ